MTDSSPATQADLNHFYSKVTTAFESLEKYIKEQETLNEGRLEAIDKQLATLVVGYAEQAVFVEALMSILEMESESKQNVFKETVKKLRATMLDILDQTSDVLENRDSNVGGTMENVVTPDQSTDN